jgi:hypothetical protein
MSWLYGEPLKGDISDFRMVRMDFCYGASNEYIMHKNHVARFVEASVKLHHTPGINPANKETTAPIWRISSAPLHGSSYWWTTPSLEGNDDPSGAAIVKAGPSDDVFIDRERLDAFRREEAEAVRLVEITRGQTVPCGECHLQPGEVCDICDAKEPIAGGAGTRTSHSETGETS